MGNSDHWWWQICSLRWSQELYRMLRMAIKCRIFCEGRFLYIVIDWLTVWEWWDHYRHPAGQWTSQVCWQILKLSLILKIVLHIAIDAQHAARPQLHNIQIQWITVLESRSRKLISTTELNGQKQIGDCTLLWKLICFYSYMSQVCKWWSCELVHFLFAWSRHSIAKTDVFAIEILNA